MSLPIRPSAGCVLHLIMGRVPTESVLFRLLSHERALSIPLFEKDCGFVEVLNRSGESPIARGRWAGGHALLPEILEVTTL
jgi:hypothetical protein